MTRDTSDTSPVTYVVNPDTLSSAFVMSRDMCLICLATCVTSDAFPAIDARRSRVTFAAPPRPGRVRGGQHLREDWALHVVNKRPARHPRIERRLAVVGMAAVVLLAAASCAADADSEEEATSTDGIDWIACEAGLECASVPVPLDWSTPDGEQITISVIRHPASNPEEKIGTLFVEPGGPGDTGVGLVRNSGDDIDLMGGGRFDVVGWDPRGTYGSSPVDCFSSEEEQAAFWDGASIPSTDAEAEAFAERMRDLAQRCREVMGPVLSHISTTETVRDLDHLRAMVGEETLTLMGLSYGTFVGQVYANMYPERVRAMLLDGVVEPVAYSGSAEERVLSGTAPTDAVFAEFLRLCEEAGPERCALAGHGESVADRVNGLFERVQQAPLPVPGSNPPAALSYSDLQVSSFAPLRDPSTWTGYAQILNAAAEGDPAELVAGAEIWRQPNSWAEATKSSAISCLDGPAERSIDEWPAVLSDFTSNSRMSGAVQGWWLWAPCAAGWPASATDVYTGPWDADTDVPILLIGTRHDPNTGYQNAVDVEQLLGNAVLLTHDGYGHLSFNDASACVEKARTAYLVDLEVPEAGTVCAADQKPFFSE